MEDRITVAQALELGVAITWQQAVAVTLEAWHVADNAHVRQHPVNVDPESCVLTVTGDVLLPRQANRHDPEGARQLLHALLDGVEAPPELVDIAFGARNQSLSDDLAQFSRPNRRIEIVDVASRAVTALTALGIKAREAVPQPPIVSQGAAPPPMLSGEAVVAAAPDAFDLLRQQAAARPSAAASAAAPVEPQAPPRVPRTRQRWVPLLVGAAATIAALLVWRAWHDAASSAAPSAEPAPTVAIAPEAELAPAPPDPSWFAAGRRIADIVLRRRPATKTAPTAAMTPAAPAAGATTATTTPPVAMVAASPAPGEASPGSSLAPPTTPSPDVAPFPDEATVYTWKSEGVAPPTMLFPRMPRNAFPEPGELLDDRPYLEVLVNEQGDVDAVRLRGNLTTSEIVSHGMMLAPAKAWHFSPATRNGQPVRYVVRVLVGQ